MILQILAHLWGDYILQTDKMARLKTTRSVWALLHAVTYSLPFLFITRHFAPLFVIAATHFLIDRFKLARLVVITKNALGDWKNRSSFVTPTGYPEASPAWMAVWLLIIADNTLHLTINYAALRWL